MRSVEEQQDRIAAAALAPHPITVAIAEAQGLMCAEEVIAHRPMPAFDQAAIDGYAVRSVDIADAGHDSDTEGARTTVSLPLLGNIDAGTRNPIRLQPKRALRIQTGAPMPTLADAVLPLRWAEATQSQITVLESVPSGAYVRRVGDDVRPGDRAVQPGDIIGPAQVGLLAAVGRDKVLVHPRPRLAVLAVGEELVDVSRTPATGQVYDVNSYALAAAGRDAGAEVTRVGIVSTDSEKIREVVETQLSRTEIIVIVGGVGGQIANEVRSVLTDLGEISVDRIGMHPGSVQGFGQLGAEGVPTFLLPSNPVSALVVFEVMVRPLIRLALGKREPMRRIVRARTLSPIHSPLGRRGYLRGQLLRDQTTEEYLVRPFGATPGSPSYLLAELAQANCLVIVPEQVEHIHAGEIVHTAFLAQRG